MSDLESRAHEAQATAAGEALLRALEGERLVRATVQGLTEELVGAQSERDTALAAVARVRALHVPGPCGWCDCPDSAHLQCKECADEDHPCPTVRALDGAS